MVTLVFSNSLTKYMFIKQNCCVFSLLCCSFFCFGSLIFCLLLLNDLNLAENTQDGQTNDKSASQDGTAFNSKIQEINFYYDCKTSVKPVDCKHYFPYLFFIFYFVLYISKTWKLSKDFIT